VSLPIRDSYRVADGVLAGEYPGATDPTEAARRLARFEEHGVRAFVDLTHPADLLEPYHQLLKDGRRIAHPIVDLGTTTIPHMSRILDDIDAALAKGEGVYVHCWGGIGRTGTVIGCWLTRHGLEEGDAIRTIAGLRRLVLDSFMPSPQTTAQRAMVTNWNHGR
jgi:protein-tyrosine phosphatase